MLAWHCGMVLVSILVPIHSTLTDMNCAMLLPVYCCTLLQAEGDYYTRDEVVADYPHLRQL